MSPEPSIQRRIDAAFGTVKDSVAGLSSELADAAGKVIDATRTPLENYQAKIEQLGVLLKAGAIDQDTYARAVNMAKEALDRASGSATKAKSAIADPIFAEGARLFEAMQTPLERYVAQFDRYSLLLKASAIDQETFNRAVAAAGEAFDEAAQRAEASIGKMNGGLQQIASGLSNAFSSALDGSQKLSDSLRGLMRQLANMMLNQAFTPLTGQVFSLGLAGVK